MISYDMIIAELEKQINNAKQTSSAQSKREALAAVRALCDVALQSEDIAAHRTSAVQVVTPTTTPMPVMQQASAVVSPNQVNKLVEEDANGDSLFDF